MENFKNYLSFLAVFALLLSSCSKEEDDLNLDDDSAKATLSFGAYLNDLADDKSPMKQALENIPECSDDAPVYVEVVLYQDGSPAVGTLTDPVRITVNPDPGDQDEDGVEEYFTEESPELELEPGTYSLEHFTVLDAEEDIIWVAPYDDGSPESFAAFVDTPLPLDIHLTGGSKNYVNVEVLCFDDRLVNEYGYLFFDIGTNKAVEYCFYANLCLENDRHYPASYSVDVWIGTDDTGRRIYSNELNPVDGEGEGATASALCLALPDLQEFDDNEDYIYYEVTLLDWEGVYDDVEEQVITGTLSRNDIEANFDGDDNVDYHHLRFGCDNDTAGGDDGNDENGDDGNGSGDGDDDNADNDGDTGDGDDGSGDDEDDSDGNRDDDNGDDGDDQDGDGNNWNDGDDDEDRDGDDGDNDGDDDGDDENDNADDRDEDNGDDENGNEGSDGDGDDDNWNNGNDGDDYGYVNEGCDGAFMYGDYELNDDFEGINANRWGWANFVEGDGTYTHDLWAGAGQNNTNAGTLVGQVTYVVDGDDVEVTIDLAAGNSLAETHIYLDGDEPAVNGPGQYGHTNERIDENLITYDLEVADINEDGSFWIIVHTEICGS